MVFRSVFDDIFRLEIAIAAAVFVVVTVVLVVLLVRRRAGAGRVLGTRDDNLVLECSYAAFLVAVAVCLIVITQQANHRQKEAQAQDNASPALTTVDVTAFQWCWQFHSEGGVAAPVANCSGVAGRPTMIVPTGRPVQVRLTSRDVVHAWWVPDFGIKEDVYPDHTNTLTFTLDREGRWLGRCSEFCGTHHATMDFYVQAVSPEAYQRYLSSGVTT